MQSLNDFIESVRNKSAAQFTREDIMNYCQQAEKFKHSDDPHKERRKAFGAALLTEIGKVITIMVDQANNDYEKKGSGKMPSGCYIKSTRDENAPLRVKYRKMIPLDMPREKCQELYHKFLGEVD